MVYTLPCSKQRRIQDFFQLYADMGNKLDSFLDMLQQDIFMEARTMYGPKGYERWKNPKFQTMVDRVDTQAKLTGSCGDTMEIFLTMEGERIVNASYRTDGCASSIICGSFAAEMIQGKLAEEVLDMTGDTVLQTIGKFPEEETHCAHLAITTVKEAIHTYMAKLVKSEQEKK